MLRRRDVVPSRRRVRRARRAKHHGRDDGGGVRGDAAVPAVAVVASARRLHAVAETHGVAHRSDGDGDARRIALGSGAREIDAVGTEATSASAPRTTTRSAPSSPNTSAFPPPPRSVSSTSPPQPPPRDATLAGTLPAPPAPAVTMAGISLDAFVDKTLRLLELERVAETEQSESILRGMRPETAQRRGRALLGLKCADLRGGLSARRCSPSNFPNDRGRPAPLPPHKLTPTTSSRFDRQG